jgi:hypothetical protein
MTFPVRSTRAVGVIGPIPIMSMARGSQVVIVGVVGIPAALDKH